MTGRTASVARHDADVANSTTGIEPVPPALIKYARHVIHARRVTARFFPKDIFRDEALDILLDLFVATAEQRDTCVKQALLLTGRSTASAFRLMERLEAADLITRVPDEVDQRRMIVKLTKNGYDALIAMLRSLAPDEDENAGPRM